MEKQYFTVNNMTCGGCVSNIQKALEEDDRINTIDIQLSKKLVTVTGELSAAETASVIQAAGYNAQVGKPKTGILGKLFSS